MKILVTGPQGSGKSTQAEILAKKTGLCFVSAGELLREEVEENTTEGKEIKEDLESGKLVDDAIVANVLTDKLQKMTCNKGFVLDGYPRELAQLKEFDPKFDVVIYLDVPDNEVEKRLFLRKREDDTPEVIRERLKVYHQLTEPVLHYYQTEGKLIRVDGHKSINLVAADILKEINKRAKEERL